MRLDYLHCLATFNRASHNPDTLFDRVYLVEDGARNSKDLGACGIPAHENLVNMIDEAYLCLPA